MWIWRSMVLEAHARLDGRERANHSAISGMLVEQTLRERLLVSLRRGKVHDRPALFGDLAEGGDLEALADVPDVVLEVEQPDAGSRQHRNRSANPAFKLIA